MTTVAQILKHKGRRIVSLRPEETVADAIRVLSREGIGALLARDPNGRVAGIISERDVVRTLAQHGEKALVMPVANCMTRDVIFCAPHETIDRVMSMMTERRFRHMPVQERGELVGIISIGDVVKQRIEETEMEAQALRQYIATG
jgi:CBS domain-containing protein